MDPFAYLLSKEEYQSLPKTGESRFLVCRLPKVYTEYSPVNNQKYPHNNSTVSVGLDKFQNKLFDEEEPQNQTKQEAKNLKILFDYKHKQKLSLKELKSYSDKVVMGFPQFIPAGMKDETLGFESRFECGNLAYAFKCGRWSYELFLNTDVASERQSSWFFFQIFNTRKNKEYRFRLNGFGGSSVLFKQGMQLIGYSQQKDQFYRLGYDFYNQVDTSKKKEKSGYCTFGFTIKFPCDFDSIYLSMNYPYTYSRMNSLLDYVTQKYNQKEFIFKRHLCMTSNGNRCPYLIITNNTNKVVFHSKRVTKKVCVSLPVIKGSSGKRDWMNTIKIFKTNNKKISPVLREEDLKLIRGKRVYVIGSRVHPAETPASFVMEELLLFLSGNNSNFSSKELNTVLNTTAFIIVPMINVDGVVSGNGRCGNSGTDLNRKWHRPSNLLHPTIYNYKRLLKCLKKEGVDFSFFLDIHSHSKKRNVFIYANPPTENKRDTLIEHMTSNCDIFSKEDSTYKIKKNKERSARVVVWRQFDVENSFTLEISYSGPDKGQFAFQQHSWVTFRSIAYGVYRSIINIIKTKKQEKPKNNYLVNTFSCENNKFLINSAFE